MVLATMHPSYVMVQSQVDKNLLFGRFWKDAGRWHEARCV